MKKKKIPLIITPNFYLLPSAPHTHSIFGFVWPLFFILSSRIPIKYDGIIYVWNNIYTCL